MTLAYARERTFIVHRPRRCYHCRRSVNVVREVSGAAVGDCRYARHLREGLDGFCQGSGCAVDREAA